jgi:hypothetical protein
MRLFLPDQTQAVYSFPEGVTLVGVDQHLHGDQLQVDLFWFGETLIDVAHNTYFTAYVHLVDETHTRLAGSDVVLDQAPRTPLSVFGSQHIITLPPGLTPGEYSLVIGLYQGKEGEVINGSAVLLQNKCERC